ncbi:LLM class flavin-dependent oxidoreductase [Plantibacter sp. YIM 135249]|uniref:LLM class flavin-dependent oxidoreductase n=1 Tax=Plantibacter sp. YIM 135249 TaxID=3423918 RepID=UPI003D33D128
MTRELHLNGFLKPGGTHLAGWRHPDAVPDAGVNLRYVTELVRTLEEAKFDAIFIADLIAVPDSGDDVLSRVSVVNDGFEPITLLAALAASTERIGLIATASTSYNEPYTLARAFASLDHLSGGRAGWNVVTSLVDAEARNFGLTEHLAHGDRYARAREFFDVVTGLWDSFDDDAFPVDVASGTYFEPDRLHWLDHRGERFRVAGPLNIARPPQGRPVIAQAGSSEAGRDLAAEIGEVIFSAARDFDTSLAFTRDIKRRAVLAGRDPDQVLVLPALTAFIAPTRAQAEDERDEIQALLHPRVLLADLEYFLGGVDLSSHDLDGPLPDIPDTNQASRSGRATLVALARDERLSIRQLADRVGRSEQAVAGTAEDVADHIEEWFTAGAADGFNVAFPYLPTSLTRFTSLVVPELQRRGLFRTDYRGRTLRDHLGLDRPASRYPAAGHSTPAATEQEHIA